MIKVRIVRRKGSHAERWDMDQLNRIKGTPWEPQPGSGSQEIRATIRPIREDEPAPARIPEGVPQIKRKHRFPIRMKDIVDHGPTEGCPGCRNKLIGDIQAPSH